MYHEPAPESSEIFCYTGYRPFQFPALAPQKYYYYSPGLDAHFNSALQGRFKGSSQ